MSDLNQATLLIIDDDAEIRYSLDRVLGTRSYRVLTASSGEEGIVVAEKEKPQVVFLDNRMQGMGGIETLQHLRSVAPQAMIILMTAFGTTQTAIEAMKFGAFDYIVKPFDVKKVLELTGKAIAAHADLVKAKGAYKSVLNSDDYKEGIVGQSEPMQEVFKVIGQVAASDVTVMVTGESGTGKELIARAICQHSLRSGKPFMAVNCAAIPENLIESELFGHEKGSFTGATQQRAGKFELCDGGTLFLDEIGDMALPTQTKILRALQEGEIQRVGGSHMIKVDVRVVAATNKNLEAMIQSKEFREDLYYRLNVMRIRLPALRERPEDIPALIDFMLQRMQKSHKTRARQVSLEAMNLLRGYSWPGNVRELENVMHRSAVIAKGDTILAKDLPIEVTAGQTVTPAPSTPEVLLENPVTVESVSEVPLQRIEAEAPANPFPLPSAGLIGDLIADESESIEKLVERLYGQMRESHSKNLLQEVERHIIERALQETNFNQVKASVILGITRATLRKRIDQYGLTQ